jgi:hypothetical protein
MKLINMSVLSNIIGGFLKKRKERVEEIRIDLSKINLICSNCGKEMRTGIFGTEYGSHMYKICDGCGMGPFSIRNNW